MTDATPSLSARADSRGRGDFYARLRQVVFALFAAGVLALIVSRAGDVDWSAVARALRGYSPQTLLLAALTALLGHVVAGSYDLIGRRYLRHRLPAFRVWTVNAVAYAFSLNLGALVGGWAFRVRLYLRHGLSAGAVAQIIALAVITNWSGFVLLAGTVLMLWPPWLPPGVAQWIDETWLRAIGAALLATAAAYPLLCAWGRRRGWTLHVRGVRLRPPSPGMALVQLALSSLSWLLMSAALWLLLPDGVSLSRAMAALFASSVAGAAVHVPGGLGVLEAGISRLLSDVAAQADALAAVLVFRALYYLLPFALASFVYGALEWRLRHAGARRPANA